MTLDVAQNVRWYLDKREDTARYSSFDYCFNYFQAHREAGTVEALVEPDQLQTSCLQLGFYLASWGMFRGRAAVLSHSVKCFVPVVEAIVSAPDEVWDIDADAYTPENVAALLRLRAELGQVLPGGGSDTLVTKTMLGVFGSVPAYDRFFRVGLGVTKFAPRSLTKIAEFCSANADAIEECQEPTLDFPTGQATGRRYSKAKVIDMVFFVEGGGLGRAPRRTPAS